MPPFTTMPSVTTWMRLEPRSRNAEMSAGLQARIYDPLWLLARQWQVGEFQGEDNGSPAAARWRGEGAPLTRYYPGALADKTPVEGQAYDVGTTPLETLVERERVRPEANKPERLRFAAEAGQHFFRMLDQQPMSRNYRDLFKSKYPFPPLTVEQRAALDIDSQNFLDLVAPRVPDGRQLYAALNAALRAAGGGRLPSDLPLAQADVAEVQVAAQAWLRWYESLVDEPSGGNPAWSAERMEYNFSVAARMNAGEKVLTAPEYSSGQLDWHDFNVNDGASLRATSDKPGTPLTRTLIPAPVSYRGMPAARFWEFEDAQVDFGAVDAGPEELARMLLIEFAISYGNDWFVIPVELPVGSLCRTNSLVVTNTFGERTLIRPAQETQGPGAAWRMFQLASTPQPGAAPAVNNANATLFFLPPTLMKSLESRPLEEALFLRDEMANMAWGVERVIESAIERPLNRYEQPRAAATTADSQATETLTYRLATDVPDYWIPLLPVQSATGLRLKRGALLKPDGAPEPVRARGRILNPEPPNPAGLAIYEEEIPREGVRVTRHYQLARWLDGATHLWMGRRKVVGRGEGSSGLRFDTIEPRSE
jgi:hypothetical protein